MNEQSFPQKPPGQFKAPVKDARKTFEIEKDPKDHDLFIQNSPERRLDTERSLLVSPKVNAKFTSVFPDPLSPLERNKTSSKKSKDRWTRDGFFGAFRSSKGENLKDNSVESDVRKFINILANFLLEENKNRTILAYKSKE